MNGQSLQNAIVDTAHAFGWSAVHFTTSRSSAGSYITAAKYDAKGWPDLTLVNPRQRRTLFVEVKGDGDSLRPEQHAWVKRLLDAGNEVRVWHTRDYESGEVEAVLRGAPA